MLVQTKEMVTSANLQDQCAEFDKTALFVFFTGMLHNDWGTSKRAYLPKSVNLLFPKKPRLAS